MRKLLFGIGILASLVLFTACQQADASVPTATPTVTPVVTVAPTPVVTAKPTPTATPIPERTIDPAFTNGDFAELVLEMVNNARAEYDLEPLEMSPSLCAAAAIRADEYRQKLDEKYGAGHVSNGIPNSEAHSRLNGDSFVTVIDEIGITRWEWAGENVTANNQSDYGATVDSFRAFNWWKNSPDHWEAILYKNYTKTGIAVVYSNGIAYACQLFTTGHTEAPEYTQPSPTVTP